jgi:hypothetical protein
MENCEPLFWRGERKYPFVTRFLGFARSVHLARVAECEEVMRVIKSNLRQGQRNFDFRTYCQKLIVALFYALKVAHIKVFFVIKT